MDNFTQAQNYLYSLIPAQSRAGIFEMRRIAKKMGNPEKNYKIIHITGTSGKGSTAYLISNILKHAGYKTGLHVSPHLENIRERIQVNNKLINKQEFVKLTNKIKLLNKISYFNALILMAFLHFKEQEVDWAVIESGCGGRFDGTNIVQSKIAIITNIGLDHTEILGKTKQKIFQDKKGIIKPCCEHVILPNNHDYKIKNIIIKQKYSKFDFNNIKNIKLSLPGEFQIQNAGIAISTCLKLGISQDIIKKALTNSFFPGRLEILKNNIILDGAHNSDKMRALVKSLKIIYKNKKFIIIFACKKNRDPYQLLKILKPISKKIINLEFNFKNNKFIFKPDLKIILQNMQKLKNKNNLILITGSLYLVGEARKYLCLKKQIQKFIKF